MLVQNTATTFAVHTTTPPVTTQMNTTTGGVQVHTTTQNSLMTTTSEGPTSGSSESQTITPAQKTMTAVMVQLGHYHIRDQLVYKFKKEDSCFCISYYSYHNECCSSVGDSHSCLRHHTSQEA